MQPSETARKGASLRHAVAKPLYAQVRELILARIRSGEWAAGETLPNEFVLATECGVSIGTIRRAIEGLEESGVLVRKQGRGTYLSGSGPSALEDKFNRLRGIDGRPMSVTRQMLGIERRRPTPLELQTLQMAMATEVIDIRMKVATATSTIGIERCRLSSNVLTEFDPAAPVQLGVYGMLNQNGILVARADDVLRFGPSPVASDLESGLALGSGETSVLLDRRAYSIDDTVVEWRTAAYRARDFVYAASIV
jgi:GntR family transcriptional regulator